MTRQKPPPSTPAISPARNQRYQQILRILKERGPSTLFEIAAELRCFDHQISGRITELVKEGIIERTPQRRQKPETGCWADVLALSSAQTANAQAQIGHYPPTLLIEGEPWTLGPTLGDNDAPGVPYHRSARQGGVHLVYRVERLECPGCGKPLHLHIEKRAGGEVKQYRCGHPACNRTWHLMLTKEPGKSETLALVMKTL